MALSTIGRNQLNTGIDDNSDATAITIDSSERVGIGATNMDEMLLIQQTASGANTDVTIRSANDGNSRINFGDQSSDGSGRVDYDHTSNYMAVTTNSSERLRIDSSGNVGIGTQSVFSPGSVNSLVSVAGNLTVIKNHAGLTNIDVFNNTGDSSARGQLRVGYDASNCLEIFRVGNNADIKYNTTQGGDLHFQISGSTKTRINGNGTLISENVSNTAANLELNGASTNGHYNILMNGNANNGYKIAFKHGSSVVGTIITTNSSTAYNTSSDHRLKENVADMTGAITRVKQLSPKRFSWIVDDLDDANVDGFLAHEAQAVVPEAVQGTHNQVDDEGEPIYQGIDQSKLIPLLTAALKESIAKIETLEAKVAALEAG